MCVKERRKEKREEKKEERRERGRTRDGRAGGKEGRTEGGVKGRRISEVPRTPTLRWKHWEQCRGPSYRCLLSWLRSRFNCLLSPRGQTPSPAPVWKQALSIPLNVCF